MFTYNSVTETWRRSTAYVLLQPWQALIQTRAFPSPLVPSSIKKNTFTLLISLWLLFTQPRFQNKSSSLSFCLSLVLYSAVHPYNIFILLTWPYTFAYVLYYKDLALWEFMLSAFKTVQYYFLGNLTLLIYNCTVRKFNWWRFSSALCICFEIVDHFPLFLLNFTSHIELCKASLVTYSEIRQSFFNSVAYTRSFFNSVAYTRSTGLSRSPRACRPWPWTRGRSQPPVWD